MHTLEISPESADKLFIDILRDVADTQISAIMMARASIIDHLEKGHDHWETVQDCLEVLAAVNRLLDYYGENKVDLVSGIKEAAADVS